MAESEVIELNEEVEGHTIGTKNYRFSKIGEPVSIIKPNDTDSVFDPQNPPKHPLLVSNHHRLLFVAHSTGFCVAKTKDVIESAKKEGLCIQELSVVDVPIGKVSILALCADSSTLAASIGGGLHFFSVTALLKQDQKPSFSTSLDDSVSIKDMRWTTKLEKNYAVLSNNGKLYYGAGHDSLKDVMDNVDAVEWSVNGDLVAVARKNVLSFLSSKFKEKMSMSLSFNSLTDDSDENCTIKVDSIRWIRPDCIIIGCFQVTDDGKEENYLVHVITSKDGKITNASNPIVLSFNDVFLGLVDDAVPFGSGPHMFLNYLDQCELAFIGNRKNMDQHIVLFGWSLKDMKNEAAMIEILNDAWLPRIDCQGNGDDNMVLGLSVDKVSQDERVTLVLGEEEKEVSPCCVLLCLTVDGKLSVFHFFSAAAAPVPPEAVSSEEEDTLSEVSSTVEEQSVGHVLGLQSEEIKEHKVNTNADSEIRMMKEQQSSMAKAYDECASGNTEVKPLVNSQTFKSEEQQNVPVVKLKQDRDGQPLFSGQQGTNIEHSHVFRDFSKTVAPKVVEAKSSADSFSGKFSTDKSSQSTHRDPQKGFEVGMGLPGKIGSNSSQIDSSQSSFSGKLISSKASDVRSPFLPSSVQRNQSDNSGTFLSTLNAPGVPLRNPPVHYSGSRVSMGAGNIQSLPSAHSSQLPVQENFSLGKSSNYKFNSNKDSYRTPSPTGQQSSDQNPSKQFLNVEDMAKELDNLLEGIEGVGGFKDYFIALQKNSVLALEEGIWALSERCRMWKGTMDERLGMIRSLFDKTVEVLARKTYVEGIVKQATDSRYWDLWDLQKLNSEFELKQRHILEVNQNLTNQLIELERHFNTLEFNKFGESGGVQMNRRAFPSKHGAPRHVQSLHSLHNTTISQLAAAEKLSECLSKQMAVLSIESPSVKKENVRKELFETIGIPYNDASFNSPGGEKHGDTPSKNNLLVSPIPKEQPSRNQSSAMKSSEPETARRRRDSLDRNWATFEPPKTTVKRMLLQEDRQKTSTSKPSLSMDKPQLYPRLVEGSAVARANHRITNSTFSYPSKSKGSQDTPTKQSENPSTSFFQWADEIPDLSQLASFSVPSQPLSQSLPIICQNTSNLTSERSRSGIGKSNSFEVHESMRLSSQTPKKSSEFSISNGKETEPLTSTIGSVKHKPIFPESSFSESHKGRNFSFSPMSSAPALFGAAATGNVKSGETVSSLTSSFSVSSSTPSFSIPKPTLPTTSKENTQETVSVPGSSASSFPIPFPIFQPPDGPVLSSIIPPYTDSTSKPLDTEAAKFSFKTDEKSTLQASPPQPDLPTSTSSLKLEPSVPSSQPSSTSQSGNRLSFSVTPNAALNPKTEQPSVAPPPVQSSSPALSTSETDSAGKNESSDVAFTQEDEMEEEASEIGQTNGLAIGNLGGFGIGSTPNPTAPKPNPFGGSFLNTPANPPQSSPFTMTVPAGELFRPPSFSFPSAQPSSQPSQPQTTNFGGFGGGFGQPAQPGAGQQALGSVLGSFGQSRQIGTGLPSASGFGGGFGVTQPTGGFSSAATGGGFANMASAGGGFTSVASGGGGFASAATAGGGFASAGGGFAGAATAGGGFASAGGFGAAATAGGGFASAGGGFGGAATAGGGFGGAASGGGFGGFANQQGGSGGFSGFGNSGGTGRPPSELFTQIRK